MNIRTKLMLNWLPIGIISGIGAVIAARALALLFTFGQTSIPKDATFEQLDFAILMQFPCFMLTLAIPKLFIYFRSGAGTVANFAAYFIIPLLMYLFLPLKIVPFGWWVVAAFAFTEMHCVTMPNSYELWKKGGK